MCTTVRRAKWDKKVSENFYPVGFLQPRNEHLRHTTALLHGLIVMTSDRVPYGTLKTRPSMVDFFLTAGTCSFLSPHYALI